MGNLVADMLLNMSPNDKIKMHAWLRENIVQVAIEELLSPNNLQRLAAVIANEINAKV